jgi:uncharacterized membrane protein
MTIEQIISNFEAETNCEVLVVKAKRASHYQTVPLVYASLIALPLAWLLYECTYIPMVWVFICQFLLFLTILLLCLYEPIKLFITPKIHMQARLNQRARDILWSHHNINRNIKPALLIFIAQNERLAIIESTPLLHDKANFQAAILLLCNELENDNLAKGIEKALTSLKPHIVKIAPKNNDFNNVENKVFEL